MCKLLKSLYGLKQASRQWYSKISEFFTEKGFIQSKADYSLFTRNEGRIFIARLIYEDDIVVASNDLKSVNHLKEVLNAKVKIKDLRVLRYFLGIEVARSAKGIHICKHKYAPNLLAETGLLE